jgi:hypothetical protein
MRRTSWRDLALLAEAVVLLACARAATAVLPFRALGWIACRFQTTDTPAPVGRVASIDRIRWAVRAGARRVPFRAACFQQGLAAQLMLRRRGVSSTLYFGAAPDSQRGVVAHVWVRHGDVAVVGCEEAARFAVLARFP